MSLEFPQNSHEGENDPLDEFKEKLHKLSKEYISTLEQLQRHSKFPSTFLQWKNEIDAEEQVCLLKAEELQKTFQDKYDASFDDYKKTINPFFELPVSVVEEQTKAIEILLDDKPFDVMQHEAVELLTDIDVLKEKNKDNLDLFEELENIKTRIEDAIFKVYDATNSRTEKLHEHYRELQQRRQKEAATHITKTVEQYHTTNEKIIAETRINASILLDTYNSNCTEIIEKAFDQLKSEEIYPN